MVRLKVINEALIITQFGLFQFQNGAIKRMLPKATYRHNIRFQFQNGAIKRRQAQVKQSVTVTISIPKWCD